MNSLHLQLLVLIIAGWVNRSQQDVIEYLQAENRVLRGQLGGRRLRFTDGPRRRLAAKAKRLGRDGLFGITTLVRIAQGSATVAMITAVGIFAPIAAVGGLAFHPLYLALAIGCGSKPYPWMNDSGFWIISTMSGFTGEETLKTASVVISLMGVVGLGVTLLGAWLFPLV